MPVKHIEYRDLVGGVFLAALGLFVALYAGSHYQVGQPSHMGPGFFPVALGWILAVLGTVIALLALRRTAVRVQPASVAWRSMLAVLGSIATFGALIERLGLVPATIAMTLVAAFAERPVRLRRALLLGAALALMSWLIFIVGLQMTLPAFALPN